MVSGFLLGGNHLRRKFSVTPLKIVLLEEEVNLVKTFSISLFVVLLCGAIIFIGTTTLHPQTSRRMKISVRTSAGEDIELYNASYALVIGNGNYTNGWNPLPGALQDVKEVAEALQTHNFNVTLKTNLTADEFEDAFLTFVLEHGADETNRLLFYYAGHGYTLPLANEQERGYLVMVDAPEPDTDKLGFVRGSVNMETLVGESKAILARHVLFLFDCCFSGTILNARDRVSLKSISDNIRHPVRQFITAGRANEPVPDRSVFKTAFLDLIDGRAAEPFRDGYITGAELGLYLKNQVPIYNEAQHPQYGKIRDPKLDKGDFVFVLPQRNTSPPQAELLPLATVSVTSTPSGATVYLDGTAIGKTPLRSYEIDTGVHREKPVEIGLELAGYKSRVKSITVTSGQNLPWDVLLEPMLAQQISGQDGADMVLIPAGDFQMGSNDSNAKDDEKPVHTVYVDAFYMDTYEVTNAQFKAFVDANPQWRKNQIPRFYHNGDYLDHWNSNDYPSGRGNYPVVFVSWYSAMAYAQWAGKRLPTEAEWEKAARGGLVGKKYPWGDTIDANKANYRVRLSPGGRYPANNYGLYDMCGNVGEWCLDAYDEDFYVGSPRRNPVAGGWDGNDFANVRPYTTRVSRGGFLTGGIADRDQNSPTNASSYYGFRCAMAVTPPSTPQTAAVPNQENVVFKLTDGELIAKSDIESLRDRDEYLGPMTLWNDEDEQTEVTTCREYDAALQRGYYARSNLDRVGALQFHHRCGLLNSLHWATPPQQSFISNPRVGVADLELLPLSLYPSFGSGNGFSLKAEDFPGFNAEDLTYQTAVDTGNLIVQNVSQDSLSIDDTILANLDRDSTGTRQSLEEVVRADFNGDGIEDVLLFEDCLRVRGWAASIPFGSIIILTRKSRDEKFEVIFEQRLP